MNWEDTAIGYTAVDNVNKIVLLEMVVERKVENGKNENQSDGKRYESLVVDNVNMALGDVVVVMRMKVGMYKMCHMLTGMMNNWSLVLAFDIVMVVIVE